MRGRAGTTWRGGLSRALAGLIVLLLSCAFEWPQRTARILAELEQSEDLVTRCDLVRLLGRRDDADAEAALVGLLADPRAQVRREAARGLKGRNTASTQAALTAALTDSDPEVRIAATEGLAASGTVDSIQPLTRALGDAHADVRSSAATALAALWSRPARTGAPDKTSLAPIAVALDDEAPQVRRSAARALAAIAGQEAVPALTAKLHDPAPEVRVAVFELLATLAPHQAEPWLLQALDESSASMQLEILRVLASLSGPRQPETLTRLESLSRKGRPQLAATARVLLSSTSSPPGSPDWVALLAQTEHQAPESSDALLGALERALPRGETLAVDPLLLWLARAPDRLRGRIAALVARARPEASEKLLDLTQDRDPNVRRAIMGALGSCNDPSAVAALLAALDDPQRDVALTAARSLGERCTKDALSELRAPERWDRASAPMVKRLTLALVSCLEHLPSGAMDTRTRGELEQRLLSQFEASTGDPERASLSARGLFFFPSERVFAGLKRAYPGASTPLRVAILRASAPHHSSDARELRRTASNEDPPAVAATAKVAAWLARDPANEPPEAALGERAGRDLVWPLGPVQAFLLASDLQRSAPTGEQTRALCAALASPEPLTRANARAGWAFSSPPLGHCATPAAAPAKVPTTERNPPNSPGFTDSWEPGSFRALRMGDGRVLISAADASGAVSWPDLPEIVTENPWPGPYAAE